MSPTGFRGLDERGFTLLEVLVAVFIFSVLATTLFSSFNFLFKNVDAVKDMGVTRAMAARAMARIVFDLRSAHVVPYALYTPPETGGRPDPYRIEGGPQIDGSEGLPALRFSSRAHLPVYGSIETGIAEIVYYLYRKGDGPGVLKRADRVLVDKPFEASEKDPAVCESVESVSFAFYDREGNEFDHWDSDSEEFDQATPAAVEIRMRITGESGSFDLGTRVAVPVFREKRQ